MRPAPPSSVQIMTWRRLGSNSKMVCVACLTASRCSYVGDRSMQAVTQNGHVSVDFAKQLVKTVTPVPSASARLNAISTYEEKMRAKDQMFEKWLPVTEEKVTPQNAILAEQTEFLNCIENGIASDRVGLGRICCSTTCRSNRNRDCGPKCFRNSNSQSCVGFFAAQQRGHLGICSRTQRGIRRYRVTSPSRRTFFP